MTKETSNKSSEKKSSAHEEQLVIRGDELKSPLIQAYLKRQRQKQEQEARKKYLPEVIKAVSKVVDKEFKTLNEIIKFFSPPSRAKRAKALTEGETKTIDKMVSENKKPADIAREMKKKAPQIYRYIKSKETKS